MLSSELYKIMVRKVTFEGFRRGDCPNRPPWVRHWFALYPLESVKSQDYNIEKSYIFR